MAGVGLDAAAGLVIPQPNCGILRRSKNKLRVGREPDMRAIRFINNEVRGSNRWGLPYGVVVVYDRLEALARIGIPYTAGAC